MADYFYFGRPKLPRGSSYPIQRSELDRLLGAAVALVSHVGFGRESENGVVLSATYYGTKRKHQRRGIWLAISAVPSRDRRAVHDVLVDEVFPTLVRWIRSFDEPDSTGSKTDHDLAFYVREGKLEVQQP